MSALLEQLKASLGSQYRIERELGGGGMSRVFLAEEMALGRLVVLKVLPSELGAMLSADRFQREVRLAASLQHPHIVTLLSAGRAGDALYYTMPYVEGESLRARLQREGELPVPDTVRILRELVDALVYAHGQGLIHRDIKPDNVLLSHGHAVVTDFGIAKALSAADETGRLTGTGVSIGTPSYMAPEQAAGDPIDQRADLYSVGVLAYELLAGEPPFRGATAQAVIAAHLGRTAPHILEQRPSVPPELATIIARCMEKRPADRYQRAEELLSALEEVITAPVTSTPRSVPSPTPNPQPPTPRVWSLPSVLGAFAAAGAVVLAAAWGLRSLLGLPDWFFPAALVLLAVGLPIVLLAARVHNRRALRPAGTFTSPSGGFRGSLTLRRAVTGGVAAFAALGLVTAGYMAMRSLGIGPVGTLVASGKLGERERLIIADFTNTTRDSMLGPAVTQAFRVDFSQSKLVSPVEADYVRRVLRRMQVADSLPVSLALAREIAERQGWKAVVAGELQQVGPSLLVSAQLVNAQSGEVLATARHTARDSTAILDAVDRVSKQLRERIGESLRSIRGNAPLAEVTTSSLEALRKYSQALRAENAGDRRGTIARLEEAVAADTGFAMAWRKLGVALFNEGERQSQAAEAVTRAFRLRERLTFRERKLTENSYYSDVVGDLDSAAAALGSILAEYPSDSWAFNNLGVINFFRGDLPAAEEAYRQSVKLEPENALAMGNVFYAEIHQAKFDAAAATLQSMRDRLPAGPTLSELGLVLLLSRRDFVAAEAEITRQLEQYRGNPNVRLKLQRFLAGVLTIRGKLAEADRLHLAVAEQLALRGQEGVALEELARRASPVAAYLGDSAAARARLEEAFRRFPLDGIPAQERPLPLLINISADAGDRNRTEALVRDFERSPGDSPGRVRNYLRSLSRSTVLGMRAETRSQALAAYRRLPGTCGYCVHFRMAEAFDRSGMPDSALVYYQRWADAAEGNWAPMAYTVWQPVGWFRLAELYQAKGVKERARYYYGRFIDNWKDADPGLQPKVREARNRIRELVAEPAN